MCKFFRRKKKPFMDRMVSTVIWLNSIFAFLVLAIFYLKEQEPITLIQFWFASFTAELLAMAAIQITNQKKEGENNADN